jgi:Cu+-exporting ATPase
MPDKKDAGKAGLPVLGMHCAGCAANIERGLRDVAGVSEANVNFATARATVLYDPALIDVGRLVEAVRKSGYDVAVSSVDLQVQGISCASCVMKIETALKDLPGVIDAAVNLAAAKVRVDYLSTEVELPDIKKIIEATGYKVVELPGAAVAEDAEALARRKEYESLRARVICGGALALVILAGSLRAWFPWVPGFLQNFFVLWALATPVQFLIGFQFYGGHGGLSATGRLI